MHGQGVDGHGGLIEAGQQLAQGTDAAVGRDLQGQFGGVCGACVVGGFVVGLAVDWPALACANRPAPRLPMSAATMATERI